MEFTETFSLIQTSNGGEKQLLINRKKSCAGPGSYGWGAQKLLSTGILFT